VKKLKAIIPAYLMQPFEHHTSNQAMDCNWKRWLVYLLGKSL